MGSLYTSICPTLILEGVGESIAARQDVLKVCLELICCKQVAGLCLCEHMHVCLSVCVFPVCLQSEKGWLQLLRTFDCTHAVSTN
jgi:hypothetical protein